MAIKIIIEIILGLILAGVGSTFWNCVKSPKILGKLLDDYDELKRFYNNFLRKKQNWQEIEKDEPKIGYYEEITCWMKASLFALDKARNMMLVVIIGIFIASYFLGSIFLFINIVLFAILLFPLDRIHSSALANLFQDIHKIMFNVYKWNHVHHAECQHFCNIEQPRIFKNIYRVVTEE